MKINIIQDGIDLDTNEIEFHIKLIEAHTSNEVDQLANEFIELIEENNIYWGGGSSYGYVTGCIDIKQSDLSKEEAISLLVNFVKARANLISGIRIRS